MKLIRTFSLITILASGLCCTAQAQIPNTLKPEEKVYGLSKFWQEVNYNFVYLNKVNRKAWDSLYVAMIPAVQKTANDYEYYHELQRFCAFLSDGHTNIYWPGKVEAKVLNSMFGKYRLVVENIGGKPIITHTNLSIKDEVPIGSEVTEVNNLPVAEYQAKYVIPYIASSTGYVREDNAASRLLQGLEGEQFNVKIKMPNGKVKALQLTHARTEEKELYPEMKEPALLTLKWYPGQTAYLALNSFGDPKIDSLFIQQLPELRKAKALVIDLRNNGGGSTGIGTAILKYLTNDQKMYGSRSVTRIHVPTYKAWGVYTKAADTVNNAWQKRNYLANHDERYEVLSAGSVDINNITDAKIVVPTVVLIGHGTASAAEDFLIYADKQQHMVKMGQNTYGSTGQPYLFDLPGGGSARVCTKQDTYPDGREFVGYGIKPDIEVMPTVKDFIQNTDPALNKALAYLKGKTLTTVAVSSSKLSTK